MGWKYSNEIMRFANKDWDNFYVKEATRPIMLKKFSNSDGWNDWVVIDGDIRFQLSSVETDILYMSEHGDINGWPYYTNNDWNLWYQNGWILSKKSEGPDLGFPPVDSYTYNTTISAYVYSGSVYYMQYGTFSPGQLSGSYTFKKNTDTSVVITLDAMWPDSFNKRLSGEVGEPVGKYEGGYTVGFHHWEATVGSGRNEKKYHIYKVASSTYSNITFFNKTDMDGIKLQSRLRGYFHNGLGSPNIDTNVGFYFHEGTSSGGKPTDEEDYVMKWGHYVPDTPEEGETLSYDGHIEFTTEYEGESHPDITFVYQGLVEETDNEEDTKAYLWMTDVACWR